MAQCRAAHFYILAVCEVVVFHTIEDFTLGNIRGFYALEDKLRLIACKATVRYVPGFNTDGFMTNRFTTNGFTTDGFTTDGCTN
jgi:hypothetical protein